MQTIAAVNAKMDALDRVLDRQNYRLAFWKTASRDLGYRRFFDINTLVGLHMEDEQVFAIPTPWCSNGSAGACSMAFASIIPMDCAIRASTSSACAKPRPMSGSSLKRSSSAGEELPDDWPVEGTTGYDFLNMVSAASMSIPRRREPSPISTAIHRRGCRLRRVAARKESCLSCAIFWAAMSIGSPACSRRSARRNRDHRDYTGHEIRHAIGDSRGLLSRLPDLRSCRLRGACHADRYAAMSSAPSKPRNSARPDLDAELFDFLRDVLLLRVQRRSLGIRFRHAVPAVHGSRHGQRRGRHRFYSLQPAGRAE